MRFLTVRLLISLVSFSLAPLVLTGCAGNSEDTTKDWTAERFYDEAKQALNEKNYTSAIKNFETLEARYPYGPYAEQAQLEVAYAYYKDDQPASAIAATDRFIRLHPTHRNVDYAYYIKGLASLHDQGSFLEWLRGNQDLSDRDPKTVREAYDAFRELVTRFPNSKYAADSQARMNALIFALARSEVRIAKYYYSRGAYIAAANRAKYVVENFQQTPSIEDALGLQAKAYQAMGMNGLMHDTVRVLERNFPKSHYLRELQSTSATKS